MHAVAIVLRGSYINPIYVAIELWKLEEFAHAGILLSDGRIVEASAKANKVVIHLHPCESYNYETLLDLDHLGLAAQKRIASLALSMEGWEYDWRAFKSQAFEEIYNEEDSRRAICYEVATLATKEFFSFSSPTHLVSASELQSAWRGSFMSLRFPEIYQDTKKTCPNSPSGYCKLRGNLVECIRTKTCVVPEAHRKSLEEETTND